MSRKRIDILRQQLHDYNYEYHVLDAPTITDVAFDALMHELIQLETADPEYADPNSPSQKIGGIVAEGFQKQTHRYPMYSLGNAFSEADLKAFDQRIRNQFPHARYMVELKIDGLAMSMDYEDGQFFQAVTRGDGSVGEVVSANIRVIDSIPLRLKEAVDVTVRGEIFMSDYAFSSLNASRHQAQETLFANPRNAAAGTIRQLDANIVRQRRLDGYWYTLVNADELGVTSQSEALETLKRLGFKTNPEAQVYDTIEAVYKRVQEIEAHRDTYGYDIDGVVIKVDQFDIQKALGFTIRTPRFAIAYKFKAEEVASVVEDIFVTVGRTGKITPNAKLNPVSISGSIVSYATLHNEDYIKHKDIRIGDRVLVRKAGEIIPEIVRVDLQARTQAQKNYEFPKQCSVCDGVLVRDGDEADHYCINANCPAKIAEALVHFASRDAMNIDTLGEKRVYQLHEAGLLSTIPDIYALPQRIEDMQKLEKMGAKSVEKLCEAIEKSKENSLEKWLFGLGIRHVGAKTSKVLANHFQNIHQLMQANVETLVQIDEIGGVIAQSVVDFFAIESNQKLIDTLLAYGLQEGIKQTQASNQFEGMRFVLTGTLQTMGRSEAKQLIEARGGSVMGSVSSKTSVLIYGEAAGSKLTKAQNLGVTTWTETVFLKEVGL